MTDRLAPTPEGLARAASILAGGGLVAFPTDTVYGVAVAHARPDRLAALFALKRRPVDRRIPVLARSLDEVAALGYVIDFKNHKAVRMQTYLDPKEALEAAGLSE